MNELHQLELDLTEFAALVPEKVAQAVQQAALKTAEVWSEAAESHPIGRQYADTIDYDLRHFGAFGQVVYAAEIGPDLARYGGKTGKGGLVPSFGFLDEPESTAGILTPPIHAGRHAAEFAEEELARGVGIALAQSLRAHDL